jgi:uncharacterized membrane protein YeaQ/YmgE (transglycosylase-associated protein family)
MGRGHRSIGPPLARLARRGCDDAVARRVGDTVRVVEDHDLIAWLIIGLVAGALAGRVVQGRGLGIIGDLAVGAGGAVIGGVILRQLAPDLRYGFLGSIVVAFVGASLLLAVLCALTGRRPLGRGRWHQWPGP